jgi:hypothetical protein
MRKVVSGRKWVDGKWVKIGNTTGRDVLEETLHASCTKTKERECKGVEEGRHGSGSTLRPSHHMLADRESSGGSKAWGKQTQEKVSVVNHKDERKKQARDTDQDTNPPPSKLVASELVADAFTVSLARMSTGVRYRTWPPERTIMLRMTSKKVQELVDKVRPPAVVRLSRSFWEDVRNGTGAERLNRILAPLATMPTRCRIITLDLSLCNGFGPDGAGGLQECWHSVQSWLTSI